MNFDEMLRDAISSELSHHIDQLRNSFEIYPHLPEVATTGEIAAQFRVSDDVVRRMCADGMPHVHAGREMRFPKKLIAEWSQSGRAFPCEICAEKSGKPDLLDPFAARGNAHPDSHPILKISEETNAKLSNLAK